MNSRVQKAKGKFKFTSQKEKEKKKEEKCKMFSNLAVKFICHVALKFFFPF